MIASESLFGLIVSSLPRRSASNFEAERAPPQTDKIVEEFLPCPAFSKI